MFKITAVKKTEYKDLMEKYELPQELSCNLNVGDTFHTDGVEKPLGLCNSAGIL